MQPPSVTPEQFRAAMGSFAAGVTIVTTIDEAGKPQALTATAFSSVSLNPPLCLVCVDRRARSHQPLLSRRSFAVNILSADQEVLSRHFAAPMADRFSEVPWRPGRITRCPRLKGVLAFVECVVAGVHDGGDHDIFLGHVAGVEVREGTPLVYWRGTYSSLTGSPFRRIPAITDPSPKNHTLGDNAASVRQAGQP